MILGSFIYGDNTTICLVCQRVGRSFRATIISSFLCRASIMPHSLPPVGSPTGSRLYVYLVSLVAAVSGLLFGFDNRGCTTARRHHLSASSFAL